MQIIQVTDYIPPDDVNKGMRGYGLSVFEGVEVDTFGVEITGKMSFGATGRTIILAELSGDVVEEAGILAGISGSPVYINDKLLGAVAYGFSFSKKPICGITPFAEMKYDEQVIMKSSPGMTPIEPILSVSGFPGDSYSLLDSLPGRVFSAAAVQAGDDTSTSPLVPGGVCGIKLVTGDGDISAMGTITEIRGDTLYAFGHPAMGTGKSRLPLCRGKVVSYLPSIYSSFKFINAGEIFGTVELDGTSGIRGIIGKKPPMLKCRIKIKGEEKNYQVSRMKDITPDIISYLVAANWFEIIGGYEPVTMKGKFIIYIHNDRLVYEPVMSGKYLGLTVYSYIRNYFQGFQNNKFRDLEVDSVHAELQTEPGINSFNIKDILLNSKQYKANEKVNASIVVERYRKPDTVYRVEFKTPESFSEMQIIAFSSGEYLHYERNRVPDKYKFDNFSQWKNFINSIPPGDEMIFVIYKSGSSIGVEGGELKDIPVSIQNLISENENYSGNKMYPVLKKNFKLKGPVSGRAGKKISVRR